MKIFRVFILIITVCFICTLVLAEDENKPVFEGGSRTITEIQADEVASSENVVLKSGTTIDNATLVVLEKHRRYSELANLQLATIQLAIKKASSDYFNTFKIWLALNGVKQDEFDNWEIKENKAVLKSEDKE